jgi:cytochrome c biogenesis protein CcmG/thiol:disulfide interchange protein DsbE
MNKTILKALIPLVIFLSLIFLLFNGLGKDTRLLPSALMNKPVPNFSLPSLMTGEGINNESLKGKMYLLNVWASWCPNCRIEHPMVTEFARQNIIPVYGLNYKDEEANAKAWLNQFGNPYTDILVDVDGLVGIAFGVYGAPETFLIDGQGIIRHKIVGELNPQNIQNEILPLIEKYKTTIKP